MKGSSTKIHQDNAPYVFIFVFLCLFTIICFSFILFWIYRFFKSSLRSNDGKAKRLSNTSLIVSILLMCTFFYFCYNLFDFFQTDAIRDFYFDPYDILKISDNASVKDIKKAYRELSRIYHPDKNNGSPEATQMFARIAKAYEALVDPISSENYRKYGHPDGRQAYIVAFGLPDFMNDRSNQFIFVGIYLIGFFVLLPGMALYLYFKINQSEKNHPKYISSTTSKYLMKNCPIHYDLFAILRLILKAKEFKTKDIKDVKIMNSITKMKLFEDLLLLHGLDDLDEVQDENEKSNLIALICHLYPTKLSAEQQDAVIDRLAIILPHVPYLLEMIACFMSDIASAENVVRTFQLLPMLAQGFTEATTESIDKQNARIRSLNTRLPQMLLDAVAYVDGENDILINDLVICEVELFRKHLQDGEMAGPVATNFGSDFYYETFWLVLIDDLTDDVVALSKVTQQKRKVFHHMKFTAPDKKGVYQYTLKLLSTAYLDIETEMTFTLKVIDQLT